jgi:serine/threonine-protein kinase
MGAPSPSPDESGIIALGSVLDGRYRVDAILGVGGMGRVYKAEHTGIGRAVAIKVLHARLGGSKEAAQRFQREALASGRLDHPNIVGVSDFGVLDDGSLYLVMEALDGEALGKRLERDKRIAWPEAMTIVRGMLAGLRHAHEKGVVHRDIKPDNIYLAKKDGEQVIKILDFGIAKLYAGNADDPATTRAGLTVGTPAYLSPEQAVGGAITPASDLYSTSVVLYEMLTGRTPFLDTEPLAMLTAHVSKDPPPFSEIAPGLDVPPGIEAVIQRGLAKVSAERISSAVDYMQQLDEAIRAAGYESMMGSGGIPRASGSLNVPSGPHSHSSSLAIPAGPHAGALTPPAGFMSTPMPTAYGSARTSAATPAHGVVDLGGGRYATPSPAEMNIATQSIKHLPAQRPRSIADVGGEPLSRSMKTAALVIVLVAVLGAVYFMFLRGDSKGGGTSTSIVTVPVVDRETQLKAALHDLENGKTCADRKAAIPIIVRVGDPSAIPTLKKARYRMRGGVLGIGDSNTNACLKQDAESAIEALGGEQK